MAGGSEAIEEFVFGNGYNRFPIYGKNEAVGLKTKALKTAHKKSLPVPQKKVKRGIRSSFFNQGFSFLFHRYLCMNSLQCYTTVV